MDLIGEIMTGLEIVKKDITKLQSVIEIYKETLSEANNEIKLRGKQIDVANAEHAGLVNYYHEKEIEVKYIKEHVKMKLEEVHGQLWEKYTEKYDRTLLGKDKEEYIKRNPLYLDMLERYLAIQELYDQYVRVRDGFTSRGYVLNNLTRLVIATNNEWIVP